MELNIWARRAFNPGRRATVPLLLLMAACQNPADTTPPTVVSSIPANGASDIAVTTKLSIVFSEAMKPDSVRVVPTPATDLGAAVWNDARTVVYTPPGGWQAGTRYTLGVEGKDLGGNALSGNKTLAFQTLAPPDTTPPATPTGVKATAHDGEFSVEWNANPEPDLAGYTVFFGLSATALEGAVAVVKPGLEASITGLENGKTYYYAVDAYDQSGNHSAKSGVGAVTPKDMAAPRLVSSEPASGTQDLALVPALRFTFSEPMDTHSVEIGICLSHDPPVSAPCTNPALANFGTPTWSQGDTVVQFTPTDQIQAGKTHVLVIFAKDKAGNPLDPQTQIAFSVRATPDTTPPTVAMYGGTYRSDTPHPVLSIGFSEAMNQQSVQDAFLSQPPINCTWTWRGNTADCTTGYLRQLTPYTITLGTGAKDTAGNSLAAPFQLSFTTDDFAPRVIQVSPSSKFGPPINVAVNAPIILTFSEPMNPSSVGLNAVGFVVEVVGSGGKAGSLSWNADHTEMTFTPSSPYGYSKTVTWELRSATDAGGKPITAKVTGSFSTQLLIQP